MGYLVAIGDAVLGLRYAGVLGLPYNFFLDRSGIARAGFQDEADLTKIVAALQKLRAGR